MITMYHDMTNLIVANNHFAFISTSKSPHPPSDSSVDSLKLPQSNVKAHLGPTISKTKNDSPCHLKKVYNPSLLSILQNHSGQKTIDPLLTNQ